jgi:hypothetical protein
VKSEGEVMKAVATSCLTFAIVTFTSFALPASEEKAHK